MKLGMVIRSDCVFIAVCLEIILPCADSVRKGAVGKLLREWFRKSLPKGPCLACGVARVLNAEPTLLSLKAGIFIPLQIGTELWGVIGAVGAHIPRPIGNVFHGESVDILSRGFSEGFCSFHRSVLFVV